MSAPPPDAAAGATAADATAADATAADATAADATAADATAADASDATSACARALLAAPNPFADSVARLDAGVTPPPHLDTLHATVRAELRRAIASVGTATGRAAMVLVHGEPGQGKTHELARLRADARTAYHFVEIPPLKDAGAPFQHVLRYTVQGLIAQQVLDRFLWEALLHVTSAVRDTARATDDGDVADHLDELLSGGDRFVSAFRSLARGDRRLVELLLRRGRALPPLVDLDPEFSRVLCRLPDRDAEAVALDWLRGVELPDEDLQLLGVTRSLDSEARCFEILRSLVRVSPRPLALCFDQLESTSGLLGVAGSVTLFTALMELYQQLPLCVILMCQTQVWAELRAHVPQAAKERIRELPNLSRPTPVDATLLVAARLLPVWRSAEVAPPYPSWPFPADYVAHYVREMAPSVRQVLMHCAARLDEMRGRGAIEEPHPAATAIDMEVELHAAEEPEPREVVAVGQVGDGVPAAVADDQGDVPRHIHAERSRAVSIPAPASASSARSALERRVDLGAALASEHRKKLLLVGVREDLSSPSLRQERLRSALVELLRVAGRSGRRVVGARILDVDAPPKPTHSARPPFLVTLEVDDPAVVAPSAGPGTVGDDAAPAPRRARIAIEVHGDDARGATRALDRLEKRLHGGVVEHAFLLREEEAPVGPSARRTLERAAALEPHGGILYLDRATAHRLVAAELLLDAVSAAEVSSGDRAVTRDEALSFLVEQPGLAEAFAPIVARLSGAPAAPALASYPLGVLRPT